MTSEARAVWLQTLCDDLGHFTDTELADGCRRYRTGKDSVWFPSSGKLIESCKDPFGTPRGKTYPPIENYAGVIPQSRAQEVIEATREKYGYRATEDGRTAQNIEARKRNILERPPLVMTEEMRRRERELAPSRAAALERALSIKRSGHGAH